MLEGEECMDPKGVTVRALAGKPGCAYLDPGAITGGLSYVCSNLINPIALIAAQHTHTNIQKEDTHTFTHKTDQHRHTGTL